MGESKQYQAKTIEVALSKAARDLGIPMEAVRYEIVFDGRKGLFGFGQRDTIISVDVEQSRASASAPAAGATELHAPAPVEPARAREKLSGSHPEGAPHRRPEPPRGRPGRHGGGEPFGTGETPRRGGRAPRQQAERHWRRAGRTEGPPPPGARETRPEEAGGAPAREPAPPPSTPAGRALLALGERLIGAMGLDVSCGVREEPDRLVLECDGPDERLVIGRHGDVLEALQYLVNRMIPRDPGFREAGAQDPKVTVDSAGYRRRRDRELEERALRIADEVLDTGEAIEMEPMNPYQRRVVHLALREESGIRTYSSGEGFMRRLTIAPATKR